MHRVTQKLIFSSLALLTLMSARICLATPFDLDPQAIQNVFKIGRAIHVVHPGLRENKYLEYAVGIYRASLKYGIEPSVLIGISQQETGFRENLPEGKAGERGICQVLKGWLHNPRFKAEFRGSGVKDFMNPAKSFQFAAWILKDLKKRSSKGALPYWSYYNANKFHNRFKYFMAVNRYMAMLKKNESLFEDRKVASTEPVKKVTETSVRWVPDALRRLQLKSDDRMMMQAGTQIDISGLFLEKPVQD